MNIARKLTLSTVLVVLGSAVLIGLAVDLSIQRSLAHVESDRLGFIAQRLAADLDEQVNKVRADALALANAAPFEQLLVRAPGQALPAAPRAQVARIFSAVMLANPNYLQVRLIGSAPEGVELIRLDRAARGQAVQEVPDALLQPKGDRPYVREAITLGDGEVVISPLDLNQERGQIQVPHVPVLRASTAVKPSGSDTAWVVVINVDMRHTLMRLRAADATARVILVDADGRYLVHPQKDLEFAHELGTAANLKTDQPMLASLLGQAQPVARELSLHHGERVAAAAEPVRVNGVARWFVLAYAPSSQAATARSARLASVAAAVLAALVGAAFAFWVARSVSSPLVQVTQAAQRYLVTGTLTLPKRRSGEIGELTDALARMDDTVRTRSAELARQEQNFRLVFETTATALLQLDAHRHIVLVNHRAETLFGYSRDELLGQPIELLVPLPHRAAHPALVSEYLQHPAPRAMGAGRDLTALRKDGTEVAVEIGLSPMATPDGVFTLASVVDITERKRQDDELRRSNAELEQFAYVASHDLQEPLRMVVSYSELLAQRYQGKLDEKADKYIHYAVDGARRMQRLVADLMAYSRVGSQGKPQVPVDAGAVLQRVLKVLKQSASAAGATIDAQPLPTVLADELQLEQLLQNLIGNAIKFRGETPLHISVGALRQHQRWEFFVKDNGIGIEPQYADRIFQMFQRLHERGKYEGSGIGLAIVKRIVERHGGQIQVESAPGQGATFQFTLRAVPGALDPNPAADV